MQPSNSPVALNPRNDLSPFQRIHSLRSAVGQGDMASDLSLVGFVLAVSFTYLEVHPINSLLIAIAVVSQAALGTVVLIRVLPGTNASATLLLGPGVIFGGTISFAIFQIVGRGYLGLILVIVTGLAAVMKLVFTSGLRSFESHRIWWLTQMVGLAALVMTSEFGELLPVALGCFVIGLVGGQAPRFQRLLHWITSFAVAGLIFAPLVRRQDYWWLVTDDFIFFEVLSRHITNAGPLANWGPSNWSQYHWLSYGWSGLLNVLGGSPASLTTLTRVMPFLYSISLGASLICIANNLSDHSNSRPQVVLTVWAVVSLNPLDWSGISTAGIYAVLAALVAVVVVFKHGTLTPCRRLLISMLGLLGASIALLTKLPSLFTILSFISLYLVWRITRYVGSNKRLLASLLGVLLSAVLTLVAVWFGSHMIGGWTVATGPLGVGYLSGRNPLLATFGMLIQHLWLFFPITLGVLWNSWGTSRRESHLSQFLAFCAIPLFAIGVILNTVVLGSSNTRDYFSGPTYFVGSLVLLQMVPPSDVRAKRSRAFNKSTAGVVLVLILSLYFVISMFADQFLRRAWLVASDFTFAMRILREVISHENRLFLVAISAVILIVVSLRNYLFSRLTTAFLTGITIVTIFGYANSSIAEFRFVYSTRNLEVLLGSVDERNVGIWIGENSEPNDLIATNALDDPNYRLAMLSQRQFFTIGTKYTDSLKARTRIDISNAFSDSPSAKSCAMLIENKVKWFIIDRRQTTQSSWGQCATKRYESGSLMVLELES